MAAGIREAILFEIYGDDSTGRDGLGKTYRDRSLAAAAIEAWLGVDAERKSLENVAPPLSAIR